jgi:hypothetical protein
MKIAGSWPLAFSALLAGASIGYCFGRAVSGIARSDMRRATAAQAATQQHQEPRSDIAIPVTQLEALDGKRFLAALPDLLARAYNGNVDAMRLVDRRFDSCAAYVVRSDEEMAQVTDREYERQLDIVRQLRAAHPQQALPPSLDEEALAAQHAERLRQATEQNDLCRGLTAAQIETRLVWAQRLVEAGDRDTILGLTRSENRLQGADRLRNAERLAQLAISEDDALDRLIGTGDLDALERAMRAHDGMNAKVVRRDPQRAYVYAYALSLAAGDDQERGRAAAAEMGFLERGGGPIVALTPAQIEQAGIAGAALFKRCCANLTR